MEPNNNILVVEDSEIVCNALKTLLEAADYRVVCQTNEREALDYLRGTEPPLVILLDLNMPMTRGRLFRKKLLQEPDLAAIPVFVFFSEAVSAPHYSNPDWFSDLLEAIRILTG